MGDFPKRLDRKTIYESKWIRLHLDKVEMPSGKIIDEYHFLDYPGEAVAVVLENEQSEILMIRSLRYVSGKVELEIPAGGIDAGELPEIAAKREFFEETGIELKGEIKKLLDYNPSNGMANQKIHIVAANDYAIGTSSFDTDEVEGFEWIKIDHLLEMIRNNELKDGISVMGILHYHTFCK